MSLKKISGFEGMQAKVVNPGNRYPTFIAMAELLGYPQATNHRTRANRLEMGELVKIVASGTSSCPSDTIHAVERHDGTYVLIGIDGLEILPQFLPQTLEEKIAMVERLKAEIEAEKTAAESAKYDLQVGDYAIVDEVEDDFYVGTVVRITEDDKTNCPYRAETPFGNFEWFPHGSLARISPEEARAKLAAQIDEFFGEVTA